MDLPHPVWSNSIGTNSIRLPDLKNVGLAVGISFLSHLEAEKKVFPVCNYFTLVESVDRFAPKSSREDRSKSSRSIESRVIGGGSIASRDSIDFGVYTMLSVVHKDITLILMILVLIVSIMLSVL